MAPVDAATIVLVRAGRRRVDGGGARGAGEPAARGGGGPSTAGAGGLEVLLTRRPDTMAFAPGRHVFPGGSVHPDDHDPAIVARSALGPEDAARRLGGETSPLRGDISPGRGISPGRAISHRRAIAFHVAAVRELFEETGILLAGTGPIVDGGARAEVAAGHRSIVDVLVERQAILRTDLLVPIARWVTPRAMDRRFDTWFFAVAVDLEADLDLDPREVADAAWFRPADALSEMAERRMSLWPPTSTTLQRLALVGSVANVKSLATGRAEATRLERLRDDVVRLRFGGAGGVPGRNACGYLVGRRELVLVDPGDPSEEALDGALASAAQGGAAIRGVVITSAEPEQSAGSSGVHLELDVPIFGPRGAGRLLAGEVTELEAGDRVPVGDVELRVEAAGVDGYESAPRCVLVGEELILCGDLEPAQFEGRGLVLAARATRPAGGR